MTSEIFVAFAGSTLTAQHCLNGLTTHLSKLRISCVPPKNSASIKYVVRMHCEPNPLRNRGWSWDTDTFAGSYADRLLTAECISDVIVHSLAESLRSARKYKLDCNAFKTLLTPFVAGIRCPATQQFFLYKFEMKCARALDGQFQVNVEKNLVPKKSVAVLGLIENFEESAQTAYTTALSRGAATETEMFEFMERAIDIVTGNWNVSTINHPAFLEVLDDTGFRRKRVSRRGGGCA